LTSIQVASLKVKGGDDKHREPPALNDLALRNILLGSGTSYLKVIFEKNVRGGTGMDIKGYRTLMLMTMVACLLIGFGTLPTNAATDYEGKVNLYEQDALGQIKVDGAKGKLQYNLAGPSFDFVFSANKLDRRTSYSLILSREPEVTLPARYEVIATGVSDAGGNLNLSGSYKFYMDLLAGRILLIPTDQPPDEPLTYEGKYLFTTSTIAYDDTESELVSGGNQSPGPSGWDLLGFQKGDKAVDFSLYGIAGPASLTPGNAEQPLTLFTLSELLESKPVLLVNGSFS